MSDFIIVDGDEAVFEEAFGAAIVEVKPGNIEGSGPMLFSGKKLCVEGDEKSVDVAGCGYSMGPMANGTGTLKITALGSDQVAVKTHDNTKKVILKGKTFIAEFEVKSKAWVMVGTTRLEDPLPLHTGTGHFENSNKKFKGI